MLFLAVVKFYGKILFAFILLLFSAYSVDGNNTGQRVQSTDGSLTRELRALITIEKPEFEHPGNPEKVSSGFKQVQSSNLKKYQAGNLRNNIPTVADKQYQGITTGYLKNPPIPSLTPSVIIFPFHYFW